MKTDYVLFVRFAPTLCSVVFNALFASFSDFPLFLPFYHIHRMFFAVSALLLNRMLNVFQEIKNKNSQIIKNLIIFLPLSLNVYIAFKK